MTMPTITQWAQEEELVTHNKKSKMESSVDIYTVNDSVNSGDNDDSNYLNNIFSNITNRSAEKLQSNPIFYSQIWNILNESQMKNNQYQVIVHLKWKILLTSFQILPYVCIAKKVAWNYLKMHWGCIYFVDWYWWVAWLCFKVFSMLMSVVPIANWTRKVKNIKIGGTSTRSPVTVIIADLQIPCKHKVSLNFFLRSIGKNGLRYTTFVLSVMEIQIVMLHYERLWKMLPHVIVMKLKRKNVLVIFRKALELHFVIIKGKRKEFV